MVQKNKNSQLFYSNGKLLITAEYLVLNGAEALALPTKFGQYLEVENKKNNTIIWTSFDADETCWFKEIVSFNEIIKNIKTENPIKNTLIEILHFAHQLNSEILNNSEGFSVETKLTFPRNWGLGSSSTLINNIAQWFKIDAFVLLNQSFGGSGYDIACAQNNTAIIYQLENQKPVVKNENFSPSFKENCYFLYLNKKQNSKTAIENYKKKQFNLQDKTLQVSAITNYLITENSLEGATILFNKHESILAEILETPTIKQQFFPDFNGTIKSLGAWGGDFVMVLSKTNPSVYFTEKGYDVLLTYDEMILV